MIWVTKLCEEDETDNNNIINNISTNMKLKYLTQ